MRMNDHMQKLIDSASTFDLCDAVCSAIEEAHGYDSIVSAATTDIPPSRRAIHFVWSLTGFLECNGFHYFWGLNCDHGFYSEAFSKIGMPEHAKNIRDSLSVIVDKGILGDCDTVANWFGSEDAAHEASDRFETFLFAGHDQIEETLANYIRARLPDLSDLYSAITKKLAND